ncbi:hypothetical protein AN639_03845 [Candidatus Epulonipiscium fishelsonii]|uniref:Uncharacterized protein n=1 Tax=Candidatus Epulonipiscium fishelsonii TaxID=77094 RepID=A0ACC8XAH5_9FIRM|nr:hypothetical protein AN396_08535 [Epulopiscium sp. SCG-B11WGA-EpuloA1]ONI41193.1 hypothetical protein AN639_03845 [Epulopiscium sp. SCG-B05WGA-EpuloA1]
MIEKKVRWGVVLPPFILIIASVVFNIVSPDAFMEVVNSINNQMLSIFGSVFSWVGVIMCILCILLYFHPLASVKIGGEEAKPILSRFAWFSISLCTSVAAGVIFWAIAEPLYHLTAPPAFLNIDPNSQEAAVFSMATLFLHWCFTPYSMYTIPAVVFAFMYYNQKKSNSLSAISVPLIGDSLAHKLSGGIDALALYTLIPGMASSIATGVLNVCGGINHLWGLEINSLMIFVVMFIVVLMFVVSCTTGLTKGIQKLSRLNIIVFGILLVMIFIFIDKSAMLKISGTGFKEYIFNFIENSTLAASHKEDSWGNSWTVFYWCNWMAWAPITALFLGRISYGYTIRQALTVNFLLPSLFAIVWIGIFSGSSIVMQMQSGVLGRVLLTDGPEVAIFEFLGELPFMGIIIPLFLMVLLLSLVTACDSTTSSMASLCYKGLKSADDEVDFRIKIFWGVLIGALGFIMLSTSGINGIKVLSNIGGFPGLIIQFIAMASIIKIILTYKKDNHMLR